MTHPEPPAGSPWSAPQEAGPEPLDFARPQDAAATPTAPSPEPPPSGPPPAGPPPFAPGPYAGWWGFPPQFIAPPRRFGGGALVGAGAAGFAVGIMLAFVGIMLLGLAMTMMMGDPYVAGYGVGPSTYAVEMTVTATGPVKITYGFDGKSTAASTKKSWKHDGTVDDFRLGEVTITVPADAPAGTKAACRIDVDGDTRAKGEAVGPGSRVSCLAVNY